MSLLGDGRDYYRDLVEASADLSATDLRRVRRLFARAHDRAHDLLHGEGANRVPVEDLGALWVDLWRGIRDVVDADAWDRIRGLAE